MKKRVNDNQKVTLTVGQLKKLVREDMHSVKIQSDKILPFSIHETVEETANRIGIVTEMSISLKDYREKVEGLKFQLVENWCLCKYCQLFNQENDNRNHWATELIACIKRLKFQKIKGKVDKKKTLTHLLIDESDFNDAELITQIFYDKFNAEHITDNDQRKKVATEFANNINGIIDLISTSNGGIDSYMLEVFGVYPPEKNSPK